MAKKLIIIAVLVFCVVGLAFVLQADADADDSYYSASNFYVNKAQDAFNQLQYDDAIKLCDQALQQDAENIEAHFIKAKALFEQDKHSEAGFCLDLVLKFDPWHAEALHLRALVYAVESNPSAAMGCLRKAIILNQWFKIQPDLLAESASIKTSHEYQVLTGTSIFWDGKMATLPDEPRNINGTLYAPAQSLLELMGFNVQYDEAKHSLIAGDGQQTVSMQIDSNQLKIGSETKYLDSPVKLISNQIYAPIKLVSTLIGADVDWIQGDQAVYVSTLPTADLAADQNKTAQTLLKKVDIITIDGNYINPYAIKPSESMLMFVAKTEDDLKLYQSLSSENQKKFLHGYLVNNPAAFYGSTMVHISFIYDGKKYAKLDVPNHALYEQLILYNFKAAMEANVVIQDKVKNRYIYYYTKTKSAVQDFEAWEQKQITLREKQYVIYCPKDWRIASNEAGDVIIQSPLTSPEDKFYDFILVRSAKETDPTVNQIIDAGQYFELTRSDILRSFPGAQILSTSWIPPDNWELKDHKGTKRYLIEFSRQENGFDLRQRSRIFLDVDRNVLVCSYVSAGDAYCYFLPVFEKMVNSLAPAWNNEPVGQV